MFVFLILNIPRLFLLGFEVERILKFRTCMVRCQLLPELLEYLKSENMWIIFTNNILSQQMRVQLTDISICKKKDSVNTNLCLHGIIIVYSWSKNFDYSIVTVQTPMIHIRVVINVCRKLHWVNTQIYQTLVKLKGKKDSLSWPTSNIRRERRWPSSSTLSNSAPCSTGSPSLNTYSSNLNAVSDLTLKINSEMKRFWKCICLWIWIFCIAFNGKE